MRNYWINLKGEGVGRWKECGMLAGGMILRRCRRVHVSTRKSVVAWHPGIENPDCLFPEYGFVKARWFTGIIVELDKKREVLFSKKHDAECAPEYDAHLHIVSVRDRP